MKVKQSSIKAKLNEYYEFWYYNLPYSLMTPGEKLSLSVILLLIATLFIYSSYKSIISIHEFASNKEIYQSTVKALKRMLLNYTTGDDDNWKDIVLQKLDGPVFNSSSLMERF